MKYLSVLSFFLILNIQYSVAQQTHNSHFEIKGNIRDSLTQKPISFANLSLVQAADSTFVKGTVSEEFGGFRIKIDSAGTYILRISCIAYTSAFIKIDIPNQISDIHIDLSPEEKQIDEVTIIQNKRIYVQEADKKVYLTANDPIIQSAFANDALQNTPGVFVEFSGTVTMRGTAADVWVNGKPLKMTGSQLTNYLEQLPASRIEKIEAVSNPSAKYTATNTMGVVNIVLKKNIIGDKLLCLGTKYATRPVYLVWSSYSFSNKKISLNISGHYFYGKDQETDFGKRYTISGADTSYFLQQNTTEKLLEKDVDFRVDLEYNFNKKTSLSFLWITQFLNSRSNQEIGYIRQYSEQLNYEAQTVKDEFEPLTYPELTFTHYFDEKGQKFTVFFTEEYHQFDYRTNEVKTYSDNSVKQSKRSARSGNTTNPTLDLSYALPFTKNYKLEVGLSSSYTKFFNNTPVDTFDNATKHWVQSDIYTRNYESIRYEAAGYSTLNYTYKKLSYKIGLRYEKNKYIFNSIFPEFYISPEFSNWYPSVHVGYTTEKDHMFSASYSRRVVKPFWNLVPYLDRTENELNKMGNPDLKLASTDSYEIGYNKEFNEKLNIDVTLYLRNTKNNICSVSDTMYDEYYKKTVVLKTFANAAHTINAGFESYLIYRFSKKTKITCALNVFDNYISGNYKNSSYNENHVNYKVRLNFQSKLSENLSINASGIYNSGNSDMYSITRDNYYFNFGSSFDFFKKRLTIGVRFYDILNTNRNISVYSSPDLYMYNETYSLSRYLQISAVWKFGSMKIEDKANIGNFNSL